MLIRRENSGLELSHKPSHQLSTTVDTPRPGRRVIDIEHLLIWTYQRQQVDRAEQRVRNTRPAGFSGSTLNAVQRLGLQGVRVDCEGSGGYGADAVHGDAQAVHDLVGTLGRDLAFLVVGHARAGTRPDPLIGVRPQLVPRDLSRKGKPVAEYSRKNGRPWVIWLRLINHPEYITSQRTRYRDWWHSLQFLTENLQNLEGHQVTGPAAAMTPWQISA